ncbi:DUF1592 domain-containing protein [Pelagicoccus sp. SDUM812005]|uniref:DUF1592 domain-containing protein n=1 Tax=Pelagicoccus sp. SDUM812005 TaxID=3041257 RepID=UPI00280DBB37|nr:DUF1592 domain-containing protein [Pelagicoccus sp. SDUM812005]MDQ8182662.1 DUF1592 domain-containing protein [Pelagicoccus sp. SDUM812005]
MRLYLAPLIASQALCLPLFAQLPDESFRNFAQEYCIDCHNPDKKKGKFDLLPLLEADSSQHYGKWEEILWMLEDRDMPPEDEAGEAPLKRPSEAEYQRFTTFLADALDSMEPPLADTEDKDFIAQNCVSCHNADDKEAGLVLENVTLDDPTHDPELFEHIVRRLDARQMPPADRKRPSEESYQEVLAHLVGALDAQAAAHPQPGRTDTFRRLNRTEYQNAIRDLLAVEIDAASLLPKDESSHGFDNVTVGNLSPTLLDRYITAAQKITRLAIGTPNDHVQGHVHRVPADLTQERHIEGLPLGTRGGALIPYTFPQDGEYEITVRLTRDRNEHVEGLRGEHQLDILLDRDLLQSFTVKRPDNGRRDHSLVDEHLKVRAFIPAGPRDLGVTFVQESYSLLENKRKPHQSHFNLHRHPRLAPAVYSVSITGPYQGQGAANTPSRQKIFTRLPTGPQDEEAAAKEILSTLMKRAYRRPIAEQDLQKPLAFYREAAVDAGFEAGIEMALNSILVSPEFLFRIERDPQNPPADGAYPISQLELASRISFFLWSSIPDDELLDHAIAGRLRDPNVLNAQIRRMLADPRSRSLANNFASQWLYLRNLESFTPDLRLYPDFDDNLRQAFRTETERFVESVIQEDRPIVDLLKSDYTYLNERLAKHYGIPHIFGSRFRRVQLQPEHHRGGILRHGSILAVTSYATRTSPTIRGNWILENIIGTPPPPPPPDIPDLEDNTVNFELPMRERLAEHRANPQCASCHDVMDPVGFVLESYDAVGRWRDFENGRPIDASGGLPDGQIANGIADLEDGLLQRPDLFARTLSEKLLTFALGRGVEAFDAPAIRQVVREAAQDDYRFSSLVLGIVNSTPFQMRSTHDHYLSAKD